MNKILLVGFVATTLVTAQGQTTPAPAPTPASAPAAPASAAAGDWMKINTDMQVLQSGDHSDVQAVQKGVTTLCAEAKDFAAKYPDDAHTFDATMLWAQLGQVMIARHFAGAPTPAEISATFDRLATDEKTPKPKRAGIRLMQIDSSLRAMVETPTDAAKWGAIEDKFNRFDKDFGADFTMDGKTLAVTQLRGEQLEILSLQPDHTAYDALAKKLAASGQPQLVDLAKEAVAREQKAADLMSKPIDLKYTAVDGSAVDLSKLRGKVVLVDFWATWCPPCRAEVPDVVAAYKKYHDQGFEITGISLDQDKGALLSYTKENGMTWPQYFDGKGWENDISKGFGISSVPTMWLVGKDGKVITTNARADLAGQVEKALAAK